MTDPKTQTGSRQDEFEFFEESNALWWITLAPTTWAVHFVLAYGGTAVWCAKFGETQGVTVARLSIAGLTVLALGFIGWLGWRSVRRWKPRQNDMEDLSHPEGRHEFLGHAAFLLCIISAIGVVYVAMPALFITTCR
ncbi:hypothetical protein [Falsirhodobacter sp. 20TX0035]|uniref:hypothetical protein n=1 Tax=Falsirhodobacter sp. 20TX0035 TaxID=3022019 RepID=UPI0023305E47|nr:hypothetical protein [Falsirhodobacter sp. 20TX0035]MDB6454870.1 hypothetical protein [Falsirhodobacter sp. 20TX0035]